jgi:hypothetical protein
MRQTHYRQPSQKSQYLPGGQFPPASVAFILLFLRVFVNLTIDWCRQVLLFHARLPLKPACLTGGKPNRQIPIPRYETSLLPKLGMLDAFDQCLKRSG